jgi:NADH dehydrogenase
LAFEQAEVTADPVERRRLLTFVVVGGGPTGVEMAGAVAELANHALARDFRAIDPMDARVILVEGGARVLAQFPPDLSAKARAQLERLRVEVRLGMPVQQCDADGVTVGDQRIAARTVIWAAGVIASPAAKWLGAKHDRAGRILVTPELLVPDCPNLFAIGDTVALMGPDAHPVPGIAPAAKQMGTYVGRAIDARIRGRAHPPPFRYRHRGNLATIGRKAAVADLGWIRLAGFPAWLLWAVAHVWFLIGWRNRLVVALNWLWNYVTFERGARLIAGAAEEAKVPEPDRLAA